MMKMKWIIIGTFMFILLGCSTSSEEETETMDESTVNPEGYWEGVIEVPAQPLEIHIELQKKGEWQGTIGIPTQNIQDFSLSDIHVAEESVSFAMSLQGQSIQFEGEVEGKEWSGTFTQSGQSFPFSLKKSKKSTVEKDREFLTIETATGKLFGEVLFPEGRDTAPVALLIPGSGPTDRNGNSQGAPGKNNSLKLLSEKLAEEGIASVRYDKRGAGKNVQASGEQEEMRFNVFVDDAKQWLELLEEDDRFTDIAVIGHSQGSLVGMMAAGSETTDAFVSIAGAGRTIDDILKVQLKESLPEDLFKESQTILDQLRKGERVEDVSQPLHSVFAPEVQPFLISWMEYDPAEQIADLDIPALIVNGYHDLQVSVGEARILNNAYRQSEILLIDEMNHVLKRAPENREENLATYTKPDLPLAEGLSEGIVDFLKQNGF